MPPRIPRGLSKKKKPAKEIEPTTAEEFFDAGTVFEDSGDRWIASSSDVPKALRFYQKAYDHYLRAIQLGQRGSIVNDAAYNVARVQYVIYLKVVKPAVETDLVPSPVIPTSLDQVAAAHERALSLHDGSSLPVDLLYTYGQVLADLGEEREDLLIMTKAVERFQQVLEYQLENLVPADDDATDAGEALSSEATGSASKTEEISVGYTVTPATVTDTILTFLDCLATIFQLCRSDHALQLDSAVEKTTEIVHIVVRELLTLVRTYGVEDLSKSFLAIPRSAVNELAISLAQLQSTWCESLDDITAIWSNGSAPLPFRDQLLGVVEALPELPNTPERFLAASDAFIGFCERPGLDPKVIWTALGQASQLLKQAWALAAAPGANVTLALKLQILLARGDTELQRSRVSGSADAEANRPVLVKNATNLYSSAARMPTLGLGTALGEGADQYKNEARVKHLVLTAGAENEELRTIKGWQSILRAWDA
ncbi:hypothetical protein D0Z00_003738 [Geotrichum galactomycetum]|uniref:Uncharacterized protein n=1 Tax=Geotrichum galactomycetum TaxID=27317 RepID=A0ACB6V0E1_9ASCO|nr:hypothetical protein D0Z00_003738 [Geotrichum candidum]